MIKKPSFGFLPLVLPFKIFFPPCNLTPPTFLGVSPFPFLLLPFAPPNKD